MTQRVKIWFDAKGDYLEVGFSSSPGFMRETRNDTIMKRVDRRGNILGFSILNFNRLTGGKALVAELISEAD